MQNSKTLKQTLAEPKRPDSLPPLAQWLAGEGAGSWFYIEETKTTQIFEITRYSPKAKIECQGLFQIEKPDIALNLNQKYEFVHLSHCAFVHIEQNKKMIKLVRI